MFKYIVLAALLAFAAAEPKPAPKPGFLAAPLAYTSGAYISPYSASYINPYSASYVRPYSAYSAYTAPLAYSGSYRYDYAYPYNYYL